MCLRKSVKIVWTAQSVVLLSNQTYSKQLFRKTNGDSDETEQPNLVDMPSIETLRQRLKEMYPSQPLDILKRKYERDAPTNF